MESTESYVAAWALDWPGFLDGIAGNVGDVLVWLVCAYIAWRAATWLVRSLCRVLFGAR